MSHECKRMNGEYQGNCSLVLRFRVNCTLDIPFCNQCLFVSWSQLEDMRGSARLVEVWHSLEGMQRRLLWQVLSQVCPGLRLAWSVVRLFASIICTLLGWQRWINSPNRFASMSSVVCWVPVSFHSARRYSDVISSLITKATTCIKCSWTLGCVFFHVFHLNSTCCFLQWVWIICHLVISPVIHLTMHYTNMYKSKWNQINTMRCRPFVWETPILCENDLHLHQGSSIVIAQWFTTKSRTFAEWVAWWRLWVVSVDVDILQFISIRYRIQEVEMLCGTKTNKPTKVG